MEAIKMEVLTMNRNLFNQIQSKWAFDSVTFHLAKVHGWVDTKTCKDLIVTIGSIFFRVPISALREYFRTDDGLVVCIKPFGGRTLDEIVPQIYIK